MNSTSLLSSLLSNVRTSLRHKAVIYEDQQILLFSVLRHCWPVKLSDEVLAWLSVCREVQMIYIWSS